MLYNSVYLIYLQILYVEKLNKIIKSFIENKRISVNDFTENSSLGIFMSLYRHYIFIYCDMCVVITH